VKGCTISILADRPPVKLRDTDKRIATEMRPIHNTSHILRAFQYSVHLYFQTGCSIDMKRSLQLWPPYGRRWIVSHLCPFHLRVSPIPSRVSSVRSIIWILRYIESGNKRQSDLVSKMIFDSFRQRHIVQHFKKENPLSFQVPEPDCLISRCRCQCFAVRRECHGLDLT
jgi:hypothetical protein